LPIKRHKSQFSAEEVEGIHECHRIFVAAEPLISDWVVVDEDFKRNCFEGFTANLSAWELFSRHFDRCVFHWQPIKASNFGYSLPCAVLEVVALEVQLPASRLTRLARNAHVGLVFAVQPEIDANDLASQARLIIIGVHLFDSTIGF
tara:strand:+ start:1639 stop:2079 length:441 start_codon:yes stop_codon:yes gene_type:complete